MKQQIQLRESQRRRFAGKSSNVKKYSTGNSISVYCFLLVLSLVVILPVIHIILSSFKTNPEIARMQVLPATFNLGNYVTVFQNPYTVFGFVNTITIAAISLVIGILISSLGAYGIARRKEKIFYIILVVFLSSMIIPPISTLLVVYKMIIKMNLMDTRVALVILYSAGVLPFCILVYSGFIKTVPISLDEAAIIEGCGYFKRFYQIVFPLVKPITSTLVLLRLPGIWNDFMLPLLFLRSPFKKTITLVVYSFTWEHNQDFGAIFALLVLAMLPPVMFFLIGQKSIYAAISQGAVKS